MANSNTFEIPLERVNGIDCFFACELILWRAIIDTLNQGEYDDIFTQAAIPWKVINVIGNQNVRSYKDALVGDMMTVYNHKLYKKYAPKGSYRGENLLCVGDDEYWGHPMGILTMTGWRTALMNIFIEEAKQHYASENTPDAKRRNFLNLFRKQLEIIKKGSDSDIKINAHLKEMVPMYFHAPDLKSIIWRVFRERARNMYERK